MSVARDNGVTKAVERDPEFQLGASQVPSTRESIQSSPSLRASETPKAQRSLPGSSSKMAKAQPALIPAMFHTNVTDSEVPLFSSYRASPVAKRQNTSQSPRVTVRTPSDVPSYPSDSEEPYSPTALSKSLGDNSSPGKQALQEEISFTSIPLKTSRQIDNLSPSPGADVSQPTSHSTKSHLLDLAVSSLDSPKFFTPEGMSPLTSGSSMRGDHLNVSFSSPKSSSCPNCGSIVEIKPFCVPEVNEEEASPEYLLDPRSPLDPSGFRFDSRFRLVCRASRCFLRSFKV
ncbi:hypothetical protein C0993_001682 [Termitomyces sp. T159_Od127]|nr:hypothetical protein C0993_001682 [Termitomyces sp. T159_Od127]